MPLTRIDWTADMLDELPDDGRRYEVIDGVLFVTPSPADVHQYAVGELHALFLPYAKRAGVNLLLAPSNVRFSKRSAGSTGSPGDTAYARWSTSPAL